MRKNVASQVICAQLNSKTDGSAVTSGTTTVYVTGDGGTQGAGGGTVTHEGQGCWSYVPTQAETNYNHVAFTFANSTAVSQTAQVYPVSYDPTDAAGLGLSRLDAAVTTRASQTSVDTIDGIVDNILLDTAEIGTAGAGLTSINLPNQTMDIVGNITGNLSGSVGSVTAPVAAGTVSDKTGYALSSGGIQAIWDALTSALTTVGSIGKLIVDNLNATISSRSSQTSVDTLAGYIDTEVAAIKAKTDNLPASPAAVGSAMTLAADSVNASALAADAVAEIQSGLSTLNAAGVRTAIGLASANLDTQLDALPTAAENADAVWDEVLSGHLTAGSTGNALNAAGSAGDPWSTSLPGAYGAGSAGKIIGDNLNATVGSRATQTSVDTLAGYVDTEVAAIKAKTDALPADPADASDIAASFVTVNSKLDAIDDYIDTEVAAVKAKTDLIPAVPASTGDIPSAATIADAVWDEARSSHVSAGSFGEGVLIATEVRIKKNTALSSFMFLMVDATDFATPETGLTVTATRSIDGGAFASCTNAAAEVGNGVYKINLSAADLNGNVVTLKFTATGAAQRTITVVTQP